LIEWDYAKNAAACPSQFSPVSTFISSTLASNVIDLLPARRTEIKPAVPRYLHPRTRCAPYRRKTPHSLATLGAEEPRDGIPAQRVRVPVLLQLVLARDLDLFAFDRQVRPVRRAGRLAAVGAVAEMAPPSGVEFRVGDGDGYGAAETGSFHDFENVEVFVCFRCWCGSYLLVK